MGLPGRVGSDQVSGSTVDSLITRASLNLYSPSGMADVPAGYLPPSVSSHADHGPVPPAFKGIGWDGTLIHAHVSAQPTVEGFQHGMHCGRSGAFRPNVD